MCGIAGIVRGQGSEIRDQRSEVRGQSAEHAAIERMVEALKHRGPDDKGTSDCGSRIAKQGVSGKHEAASEISLGHRRLAIIDLSPAGHQPKVTRDGRYTIVYNGEVYNYRELRNQLEQEGVRFRSDTDTEVVLYLFAKHNERCFQFLEGMFAFAISDNVTGELFIARDRLGIKPVYYFRGEREIGKGKAEGFRHSKSVFLFASEIRALLASGLVPRVLDPISVNSYLSFGAVQEPRTILKDVWSLPPAHFMRVGGDGTIKEINRYWNLPETNHRITRAEALAETRERFEYSVKSHLVADVPLGAFLSGGIDSSAIVATMSRNAPSGVRTFNVCFKETRFSERNIASLVAEKWGTVHTEVFLSEDALLRSLPRAFSDIDQPTIDGLNTWAISKAVHESGITVALSGVGGDELFGGYPSFRRVPAMIQYARRLGRFGLSRQFAAAVARTITNSVATQKVAAALGGCGDPVSVYTTVRGLFGRDSRRALTNGDGFIKADYDLPAETHQLLNKLNGNGDLFNKVSQLELNLYMTNMLLRDTDAMSMAHGLEVRVPFLDHNLVEWVYSLPGEMKLGPYAKSFFVEAMGTDLLPQVTNRKKRGFTLPFEKWLHTSLKRLVDGILRDPEAVKQTGLECAEVLNAWERFQRGSKTISWSRVWALVVLVNWCRENRVSCEQ